MQRPRGRVGGTLWPLTGKEGTRHFTGVQGGVVPSCQGSTSTFRQHAWGISHLYFNEFTLTQMFPPTPPPQAVLGLFSGRDASTHLSKIGSLRRRTSRDNLAGLGLSTSVGAVPGQQQQPQPGTAAAVNATGGGAAAGTAAALSRLGLGVGSGGGAVPGAVSSPTLHSMGSGELLLGQGGGMSHALSPQAPAGGGGLAGAASSLGSMLSGPFNFGRGGGGGGGGGSGGSGGVAGPVRHRRSASGNVLPAGFTAGGGGGGGGQAGGAEGGGGGSTSYSGVAAPQPGGGGGGANGSGGIFSLAGILAGVTGGGGHNRERDRAMSHPNAGANGQRASLDLGTSGGGGGGSRHGGSHGLARVSANRPQSPPRGAVMAGGTAHGTRTVVGHLVGGTSSQLASIAASLPHGRRTGGGGGAGSKKSLLGGGGGGGGSGTVGGGPVGGNREGGAGAGGGGLMGWAEGLGWGAGGAGGAAGAGGAHVGQGDGEGHGRSGRGGYTELSRTSSL